MLDSGAAKAVKYNSRFLDVVDGENFLNEGEIRWLEAGEIYILVTKCVATDLRIRGFVCLGPRHVGCRPSPVIDHVGLCIRFDTKPDSGPGPTDRSIALLFTRMLAMLSLQLTELFPFPTDLHMAPVVEAVVPKSAPDI